MEEHTTETDTHASGSVAEGEGASTAAETTPVSTSAPPNETTGAAEDELMVAMRNQDRAAIRRIMQAREGAAASAAAPPGRASDALACEDFSCSICQDLSYKPCVNECGHTFCFWCLHVAMSGIDHSHCPLCRREFNQLPAPCEALHGFLRRALPEEYARRAGEVACFEMEHMVKSPDLDSALQPLPAEEEGAANVAGQELQCRACGQLAVDPVVPYCGHLLCRSCSPAQLPGTCPARDCGLPIRSPLRTCDLIRNLYSQVGVALPESPTRTTGPSTQGDDGHAAPTHEDASGGEARGDAACPECSKAMAKATAEPLPGAEDSPPCSRCKQTGLPAPCWHCAACGTDLCDACGRAMEVEEGRAGFPGPPLVGERVLLHSMANTARKDLNDSRGVVREHDEEAGRYTCELDSGLLITIKPSNLRIAPPTLFVHFGVGCDGCGMYPIEGAAWRCLECPERIGFDLCGDCIGRKVNMGRFNQHHMAEHKMERRRQEKTWLHEVQAARPDLTVSQILEYARAQARA